jgi:hypothetical protein
MQNGELSISDYNKNKPRRLQRDFVGLLEQVAGANAPGSETHVTIGQFKLQNGPLGICRGQTKVLTTRDLLLDFALSPEMQV